MATQNMSSTFENRELDNISYDSNLSFDNISSGLASQLSEDIRDDDISQVDPYSKIDMRMVDDLDSSFERYTSLPLQNLLGFLRDPRKGFITKSGDKKTNIINQKYKSSFIIPNDSIPDFFDKYEKCRLKKCGLSFAEKQGSEELPYSGIMLDYDCLIDSEKFTLDEVTCQVLTSAIVRRHLLKHLEITGSKFEFQIFFITRPHTTKKDPLYKTGFHILIPGVKTLRSYKKYLIKTLSTDTTIHKTLKSLKIKNIDDALDTNSASVPVLFLGSCKPGGIIYDLTCAFNVTIDLEDDDYQPIIRKIDNLNQYNLSHELSLNYQAKYQDKEPLVKKEVYKVKQSIENEVTINAERTQNKSFKDKDLNVTELEVQELRMNKTQADMLCRLLDLLPEETYEKYDQWRDIIFAIANTNELYYPIAKWFSQRCPQKYEESELKKLWDYAINIRYESNKMRPMTFATIKYIAKKANPERYKLEVHKDAVNFLFDCVWKYGGNIDHYNIAKLLYILFGHKFAVDNDPSGRGYCWYEFIMPGDRMEYGELFKWRERRTPLELFEYVSEGLENVCDLVKEELRVRVESVDATEDHAKKVNTINNKFNICSRYIFNHNFKAGVIKECEQLFINHGFSNRFDKNGDLLGVANGLVYLGPKCRIINGFHEFEISKYTPVKAIPFDPTNPMTQKLLGMFKSSIPEPDARRKLLLFWASTLDGWPKDPEMLIINGVGCTSKSTIAQLIQKAYGPIYGKPISADLLTMQASAADKPNSSIAAMEDVRMVMMEETNKRDPLNPAMVKRLVNHGELSNRDLHSKQKTFKITHKITLLTNHPPPLDTKDGALKRRILRYIFKCKYVHDPQPNTYQRKIDPTLVKGFMDLEEVKSSMLSILLYFYEVLHTVYGGSVGNVPSPTIDRETEDYFNSQDYLSQFIKERVVSCTTPENEYNLNTVASYYKTWVMETEGIDKRALGTSNDIVLDLKDNQVLGKYIETVESNGLQLLKGCRILQKEDNLRPGEKYLSHSMNQGNEADQFKDINAEVGNWWEFDQFETIKKMINEPKLSDFVSDDVHIMKIERKQKKKEENQCVDDLLDLI